MQVVIVWRLQWWRHLSRVALATAFIAQCAAMPVLLFGWAAGALGVGFAMAANRVPQIVQLIRHPGDFGVSTASWSIGAVCSVAWIGYYAAEHLAAALIATVAGMIGNLVITALAVWRHRQDRAVAYSVRPLAVGAEQFGDALQLQG
jgi:hypothetical protein